MKYCSTLSTTRIKETKVFTIEQLILTRIDSEIFIQPFGVSPGNKDSGCHISLVLSKGELRPCKPQPASVFLEKMKLNHFHSLACYRTKTLEAWDKDGRKLTSYALV